MGPREDPSTPCENQDTRALGTEEYKRRAHRPRSRPCLLKGCERVFRPEHPLTRYCSVACRQRAHRWREWKARRRYRQTAGCKQKRRAQSRRYRERRKASNRKTQLASSARVIPIPFFSVLLRPPRMLRPFPADPAIAAAAFLFFGLSPSSAASARAGAALARTAPGPEDRSSRGKSLAPAPIKSLPI
jgi:hypothetical protein